MTLAKGLTGSYVPLGATIVSDEVAAHFEDVPFAHGHTFSGHPVACAAGLAAIETYEADRLIERARDTGKYLERRLNELADSHPSLGDVRGLGLFWGAGIESTCRSARAIRITAR
jgi:taurine--2-oxoglutarate transaminase